MVHVIAIHRAADRNDRSYGLFFDRAITRKRREHLNT